MTNELKEYWTFLRDIGCMVCRGPTNIHHCVGGSISDAGIGRAMSRKNNDWLVIPLCHNHHQGSQGLHTIGVRTWEQQFGSQRSFVEALALRVSFPLLERAGLPNVIGGSS